jgi:hypothetical protein
LDWKDVEEELIQLFGVNYHNYPKCVKQAVGIMKYLDKIRNAKALEKAAAAYEQTREDEGKSMKIDELC